MNRLLVALRRGTTTRAATVSSSLVILASTYNYRLSREGNDALLTQSSISPPPRLPHPTGKTIEAISQTEFVNSVKSLEGKMFRLATTSIRCMFDTCALPIARAYAFGVYLSPRAAESVAAASSKTPQLDVNAVVANALNPPLETTVLALMEAKKKSSGEGETGDFFPSESFQGARKGFYFARGSNGLGYYRFKDAKQKTRVNVIAPMMIRLNFLRHADGEHVTSGFEKGVKARYAKIDSLDSLDPNASGELQRFLSLVRKFEPMPPGCRLDLFRNEDATLGVCRDGELVGEFTSPALTWAMMDVFLDPVNGHLPREARERLVTSAETFVTVRPLREIAE